MHGLCAHPSETGMAAADLFMRLLCLVIDPIVAGLAVPAIGG